MVGKRKIVQFAVSCWFRGGGRRAHFGSKRRPLDSASAYLEILSQNESICDIHLGIEPLEIYLTQTGLDLTQTDLDLTQTGLDLTQTGLDLTQTDLN